MRYELTKDLETGSAIIDQEHRQLFQAVNQLLDACSKGQGRAMIMPSIRFLQEYVDKHFTHEEQLQQSCKYPGIIPHKAFHQEYKKTLGAIMDQIPEAGPSVADLGRLNSHIAVLVNHIRIEDKKLGAFLRQP